MSEIQELEGKRIVITGASGFIGSHLCRKLVESGAEIHAVSRSDYSGRDNPVRWWQGDLSDIGTVRNLLSAIKPDVVFHLASRVSGSRDLELVLPTFQGNLTTSVNMLIGSTEIGCQRIILVGSLEEPERADSEAIPCSPYAAAKWTSSSYARMFHALYQTPVVIARLSMVYGPAQQDLQKLIPYVILSLLRGQDPKLSSGQRLVDWIYVEDVVDGLMRMAQVKGIDGRTIDIGSGKLVAVKKIVQQIVNLLDTDIEPLFGGIPERAMERVCSADIDRTHKAIGWTPSTSIEMGLRQTVDWYKEQKLTLKTIS